MHPIFLSSRSLPLAILLWILITALCGGLILRLDANPMTTATVTAATILLLPWYGLLLFICLSNFYLCQRMPIHSRLLYRAALVQAVSGAAALAIWLSMGSGWAKLLGELGYEFSAELFVHALPVTGVTGTIIYILWVLWHYIYLHALHQEYDTQEDLETKLLFSEVELQALKASVHPHFLYNSLNMLANLSLSAPEKIHSLCVQIADFLRYSISYSNKPSATVAEEVNHVANYLKIERERFGARLQVHQSMDPATSDFQVFPLLLFPLVENAIKHGIGSSPEPGFIDLSITREENALLICVRNSVDPDGVNHPGTSHGLKSLRKRLARHYHQGATLQTRQGEREFEATIRIELHGK